PFETLLPPQTNPAKTRVNKFREKSHYILNKVYHNILYLPKACAESRIPWQLAGFTSPPSPVCTRAERKFRGEVNCRAAGFPLSLQAYAPSVHSRQTGAERPLPA